MNELKFTGIITAISNPQQSKPGSAKGWIKQGFIVTEQKEAHAQSILVEAFDKPKLFENLQEGDEVEVFYNASAKAYNGSAYGSNMLWKVNVLNKAQSAENEPQNSPQEPQTVAPTLPLSDDDMPF